MTVRQLFPDRRRTSALRQSFRRLLHSRLGSTEVWRDLSGSFGNSDYAARPLQNFQLQVHVGSTCGIDIQGASVYVTSGK
jgi:hypothetical protein